MSTVSKFGMAMIACFAVAVTAGCSEQKKEETKTETQAPKQQGMSGMSGQQGMGGMSGQQGMGGMGGTSGQTEPAPKP